jgi:hypothetical protein
MTRLSWLPGSGLKAMKTHEREQPKHKLRVGDAVVVDPGLPRHVEQCREAGLRIEAFTQTDKGDMVRCSAEQLIGDLRWYLREQATGPDGRVFYDIYAGFVHPLPSPS